jgi:2-phospho-L-lactate guanylyltransferase
VPAKRFDRSKSRLGDALSVDGRAELAQRMFDRVVGRVLGELVAAGELGGTLVVTDGADVVERAAQRGAQAMLSPGVGPGRKLGAIVDEGLAALASRGVRAALVIMGDLPSLEPDDVRALAALLSVSDVVIAPDAAGTGTNALALHLPAPMPTRFCGGASLADHLRDAHEKRLRVARCERPGLGFDVDQPDDYTRLLCGEADPLLEPPG